MPTGPVPLKPVAPAPSAAAPATPVAPEGAPTVKPTIKKETVRIEVPTAAKVVPQATVKIQPAPIPQKLPEAQIRTVPALVTSTTTVADDEAEAPARDDSTMMLVSVGVLVFAVASFGMQLWTFLAN